MLEGRKDARRASKLFFNIRLMAKRRWVPVRSMTSVRITKATRIAKDHPEGFLGVKS